MPYNRKNFTIWIIASLALLVILLSITEQLTVVDQIKRDGRLKVITRTGLTTYYDSPNGPAGMEYELLKRFAKYLDVRLDIRVEDDFSKIIPAVERRQVHLAAAGIAITPERLTKVRFSPGYQTVNQQLVYRAGGKRPADLNDIYEGELQVIAGSSHIDQLNQLAIDYPTLVWNEVTNQTSEEMLLALWQENITYTVADSHELAVLQRYYPELRVAFDISENQQLAWVFPIDEDDSLLQEATTFFHRLQAEGTLTQIIEKYYGHVQEFDYVDTRRYMRHINSRLSKYEDNFKSAAKNYDVDWRLLASLSYQESHWMRNARSPTGVRGIMMLTLKTASDMGVESRLNPQQSIEGGAKYFAQIKSRIPDRIQDPERTWFALAAYNVGLGHVEDARKITELRGGNPDSWADVKLSLPLLAQAEWYRQTKYGYARGWEPVRYVENIRSYYDILKRVKSEQITPTIAVTEPEPEKEPPVTQPFLLNDAAESAF